MTTAGASTVPASTLSPDLARRLCKLIPASYVELLVRLVTGWLIDPHETLDTLAGAIVDQLPESQRKNRTHVLCKVVSDLKEVLSVETWVDVFTELLEHALQRKGVDQSSAALIARIVAGALKAQLAGLNPEQLQLSLSCIALIVCPDPDECPWGNTNFSPFTTEGIATTLESMIPEGILSGLQLDQEQKST